MVVPQPVALGCISLVLCLLELPHGTALPLGGHRRDSPDQRPLPTASFLEDHLGPQPLALAQPVGTAEHSLKLAPKRLDAPWHRLLAPKVTSRHRLLAPKVAPRHRLLVPKVGPRHRLIAPKVAPQHRLFTPKVAPRRGHRLLLHHGPRGRRHASGHLLRVGCVLGTCQVQNLSHRLWQLMGQSGRQDSSPMNPNSPHSYG